MDAAVIVICLSTGLQIVAAFFAAKLLLQPGRRIAGFITLAIILLMAFRRFVSLYRLITVGGEKTDLFAETLALTISLLILIGVLYLSRLIQSERIMASMLADSRQHYLTLFNQSPDGVLIIGREGHIIEFNDTAARDLEYTREEFSRLHLSDINPFETREEIRKNIEAVFEKGKAEFEVNHKTKEGALRNIQVIAQAVDLSGDKVVHSIWRDITERKRAEKDLREKEEKYKLLFESANDGIFIHDETGFIDCNQRGAEMYGLPKEEIIGRQPGEFAPERQPDGRLSSFVAGEKIRAALNGTPQLFEWQPVRADGSPFDVEITLSRLELGGRICLQAIVRDITERKHAEEALRLTRFTVDNVADAVYWMTSNAQIVEVNETACSMLGYTRGEFLNLTVLDIDPDFTAERWANAWGTLKGQGRITIETKHRTKDGRIIPVEIMANYLSFGGTELDCAFARDITERKRLEQELLRSQKLEAIGTLAGGIAHDFNNLLQGIFGYISLAKMTIADKQRTQAMLEQAEQALHMSVNLTTQLLTFAKGGKPVKTTVHLQPLIENAARFALSGSRADYSIRSDHDLWAAEVDKGQFGQVIQNIVLNAEQAMPDGGTIEITARNVRAPKKELPSLPKGRYVEIAVRDTGIGIPANYLRKIFDPYFTTKEKGSGLGLATSYSIIKNHGGLIEVVSAPGTGTTFFIYLPAIEAEREVDEVRSVSACIRNAKILIMDDEELVRNTACALIRSLGHEADVAVDGESAVSKYQAARESGSPFDIVILDLTVRGGMGGREAIERLRVIDPGVRAVVSSGYSDNDVIAAYQKYGFMACLAKPYDVENLRKTLNTLLRNE